MDASSINSTGILNANANATIQAFERFDDLPPELRLRIWSFAAPRRPRLIQINYNTDKDVWEACEDGCGGLPSVVHVCREARTEALKSYTMVFGKYFDLEQDILFISDLIFTLRRPRSVLMRTEHARQIRNIAFSRDVWLGLVTATVGFRKLCPAPTKVLRGFDHVKHFSLVLLEDGVGFEDDFDGDLDLDFDDFDEEDHTEESGEDENVGDDDGIEDGDDDIDVENSEEDDESTDSSYQEQERTPVIAQDVVPDQANRAHSHESIRQAGIGISVREQRLAIREEEALEVMSKKGYFRHTGNIHLQSAYQHSDHFDEADDYLEGVINDFDEEKLEHSDWNRPTVYHYEGDQGDCRIAESYLHLQRREAKDKIAKFFGIGRYGENSNTNSG
ncbi:hypothetical protein B0J14DRAFT_252821 [Halenospora varia]|nr:hypothetical protein B0J14DRAFT_252821 [Halenospora varia]